MEVVNVTVVDTPEVVAVNVAVGFGTVVNSDSTYSATVNSGQTLMLPDTPWTDSDGTPMTTPATLPIVCTPPVGANVENSDGSYTQYVNNGATLVLPDTVVKNTAGATILTQPSATSTGVIADCRVVNSDASYDENVPAETTHNLPDITVTKNDGSTYSYPAAKDLTETQSASIYTLFPTTYNMNYSHVITAKEAGVYTNETLVNVATVEYKVNNVVKTLPITLEAGDVLLRTITQTNAALDSSVEIYY